MIEGCLTGLDYFLPASRVATLFIGFANGMQSYEVPRYEKGVPRDCAGRIVCGEQSCKFPIQTLACFHLKVCTTNPATGGISILRPTGFQATLTVSHIQPETRGSHLHLSQR